MYHQRSITAAQKAAAAQEEYKHKEELINKAKEAYAKQKQPAAAAAASTSSGRMSSFLPSIPAYSGTAANDPPVDQDPMSANFDVEAFVQALDKLK